MLKFKSISVTAICSQFYILVIDSYKIQNL